MELTRREALAALLGAPLALEACRGRSAPAPIAGSIRGASMDAGHRLRALPGNVEPPRERREVGVAVVGAGPSGLSAAWRLARLGEPDFVVFDLEARAGGTSQFGDDAVVPYPWGAHYVPMPSEENRALVTLLAEMGAIKVGPGGALVAAEEQLVRAPEERVFYKGKWHEGLYLRAGASPDDLRQLDAFQAAVGAWVSFRDGRGRRAFTLPMAHASDDAEVTALDRTTMADWMAARGFTSPRLLWLVDYACRDDYGLRPEHTSAYAGIFYFASRMPEAGAEAAPLLSWSNGNGRIVEHLLRAAEGRVRTGALVTQLVPREAGVDLTVLDVATGRAEAWHAREVVFAAPKLVAARVIRPWRDAPPPHLAAFDYGAWMVANVSLRTRPRSRGFPEAWDNVLYESPSLGYVVATHQRLLDWGPTVWTYYFPMTDESGKAGRERLLALDHAAWCDVITTDLARAHREPQAFTDHVEKIDVWRWGHAMARPKPGALWSGARARASQPLGSIHFAHSDLSGMGLFEEAQYWGVAAAEAILRARGRAFAPLIA